MPGGEGLARHEGKVVFVAGGLPGERVRARLTEAKKDYARAETMEILSPSPERVEPGCPLAGRCGGCDWLHLDYHAQLRHKVALAEDALRRMGGLAWPDLAIEAGSPWGYRNRLQLRPAPGGGLGFLARGSHAVVPAAACPVAHPAAAAFLLTPTGGPVPSPLPTPEGFLDGPPVRETPRGGPPDRLLAWGHGAESRLALEGSPDAAREIAIDILGKTIRFDLRCFFQSNTALLETLVPYALHGLAGDVAMDLYCGVGLFGAFLADRFRTVLAVEENPVSLAYARRNLPGAGHHFLEGRLEDLVLQGRLPPGRAPEAVIVDPPRPGLDQAVRDWLAETRPSRLVYVSCNPVTLARDLKSLTASGFRLTDLRLFDFYPQTAHVEAVAKLTAH